MLENKLTPSQQDWLFKVLSNPQENSKLTTKRLEEISLSLFPTDVHKYNFPNQDTCHCSLAQRKGYKQRFIISFEKYMDINE